MWPHHVINQRNEANMRVYVCEGGGGGKIGKVGRVKQNRGSHYRGGKEPLPTMSTEVHLFQFA